MAVYYLYRHVRMDKNEPFYIGIGSKRTKHARRYDVIYERAFNSKHRNYIWKGIASRTNYDIEILYETESNEEIKAKEKEFIQLYGRIDLCSGTLSNMTDGGEGTLNMAKSAIESRLKILKKTDHFKKHGERFKQYLLQNPQTHNLKKVYVYDSSNGYLIGNYDSYNKCSLLLGVERNAIRISIDAKRTHKNYIFSNIDFGDSVDISQYKMTNERLANCSIQTTVYDTIKKEYFHFDTRKKAAIFMGVSHYHMQRQISRGSYKHFKLIK